MFIFLTSTASTSLLKKREKIPYASLGQISEGRQTFEGRSITIIGLNVCADTSIGSSFGRLVPLGSVGSPIVAIYN